LNESIACVFNLTRTSFRTRIDVYLIYVPCKYVCGLMWSTNKEV